MTLTDPGLRDLYDLKVFVVSTRRYILHSRLELSLTSHQHQNADSDLMLARRIRRDVRERGRDVEGILDQVSTLPLAAPAEADRRFRAVLAIR